MPPGSSGAATEGCALNEAIHGMLDWIPDENSEQAPSARDQLQAALRARGCTCIVEWTSPMRTTREIARRWRDPRFSRIEGVLTRHLASVTAEGSPGAEAAEAATLARYKAAVTDELAASLTERGLEKLRDAVRQDERGLFVSAERWRADIWRSQRQFFDTGHTARIRTEDKLVITHADSDERIVYWWVRSLTNKCIAAFTVTFPAGGMESVWCEWITETIARKDHGQGVVLSAQLSARADPASDRLQIRGGRWASLRLVVEFDGIVDNESARKVLACFVALQGKTAGWEDELIALHERRAYIKQLLPAPERHDHEPGFWRLATLVSHVSLWHEESHDALYQIRFWNWRNPFVFTESREPDPCEAEFAKMLAQSGSPQRLGPWAVAQLLERQGGPSRGTLWRQILATVKENRRHHMAVTGAHRSGKTSILRRIKRALVDDLQQELEETREDALRVPVMIDAAVCSPLHLCIAILEGVHGALPVPSHGLASVRDDWIGLRNDAKDEARGLVERLRALEELLGRLSSQVGSGGALDQRDKFLRDSRSALKQVLEVKWSGRTTRLVILVDNVAGHHNWKEPWAQAFWRELVEAEELQSITWIVSTSLSRRDAADATPISSTFCEYNLDPLDEYETDFVINQIDTPPAEPVPGEDTVRPVLTLSARRFLAWVSARMPYLLQICCYYLFEHARRMRIPVLGTRVAVEVLDREVIPQLTDYLAGEWGRLPEDAQRYVLKALAPWPLDARSILFSKADAGRFTAAPPSVQKALLRSGLTGAHEFGLVAPLVVFWLCRSGRHEDPDPR